jgi:6-pyruvoyltetrahydropterin/6-carboxytetrahydropterin synthase
MKWRVEKEFRFEASHQIPSHQGKCQRLHGHSWKGRLICESDELQTSGPSAGMCVDFGEMSKAVEGLVVEYLDHWHLNDTLKLENPTAEEVARWIFERVKSKLPNLTSVVIDETCTSRAEYRP